MKRRVLVFTVFCVGVGAALYLFLSSRDKSTDHLLAPAVDRALDSNTTPTPTLSSAYSNQSPSIVEKGVQPREYSPGTAAGTSAPIPFVLGSSETTPAMEPATVLSNMRNVINQYGSMFGGN